MRVSSITPSTTQPFCVVAVHDKATDVPIFAMTNYGISSLDADTVTVRGVSIPLSANVTNLMYKEARPASIGTGLHRRECSFDIVNGGPFSTSPFSAAVYSAGASVDKFYFSLWVTDFKDSLKEFVSSATFLGYFDLDAGLGWDETSLSTTIRLVDRLTNLTGRYGTSAEAAEEVLAGSEYQRLLEAPAYLGFRPKVPAYGRVAATISGFETYNKSVLAVIAGLVQSSTLNGTSIELGKSPTLASFVGQSVKLKFGNGCLVTGTITDLTGGNYGINTTGMSIGVSWGSVLVYNKGWTLAGDPLNAVTTDLTSVFLDNTEDLTKLPSPTMYLKSPGTVELYNGGPVTTSGSLFCKLTGIKDEANKELSCELLKDPANTNYLYGGLSVQFDAVQQNIAWPAGPNVHLNYAMWLNKVTCGLYFSPDTFVLADIQKAGMPWELIVTPTVNTGGTIPNTYYIRLAGDSMIAESETGTLAIYANDGNNLLSVPSNEIDSVTYNCGDFGMPDLCRITFKRKLTEIDEAYDENMVYVDTSRVLYGGEVITYILDQAGVHESLRTNSLRDAASNLLGNPMSLMITTETWTELLESVVFESGLQLNCIAGMYDAVPSFTGATPYTFNNAAAPTQTFMYVQTEAVVPFYDVVDGTYKMDIGRTFTNIDSEGREFVRTHYTFQYPISYYNGVQLRKLQSTKGVKSNDRKVSYEFKHIVDTNTATAAAAQMTRLGHVANIPETTRTITVGLPFHYVKLQVLDSLRMVGFRHVSALNDPLPAYNKNISNNATYTLCDSGPCCRYDAATPYMLLPGIGIVDSLEFNFSGSGVPITLTFKQAQIGTTSNLRSVAEAIELNTATDNGTATEKSGEANGLSAVYKCPKDEAVTSVIIGEGTVKPSGITQLDPCCNSSSTSGDVESDQKITVACTGTGGHCQPDPITFIIPAECAWPNGCVDKSNLQYEPETDLEIGSTDTLIIDIISFNDACPELISINYPGQSTPDGCVSYADLCHQTTGLSPGPHVGSAIVGKLYVSPCVFNTPEGMYSKGIELVFRVSYCYTTYPNGSMFNGPTITHTGIKEFHLVVPVSLRPVSDITIG